MAQVASGPHDAFRTLGTEAPGRCFASMARRTTKTRVLKSKHGVVLLLLALAIIFALLYFGVGATAFFRTQPPPM